MYGRPSDIILAIDPAYTKLPEFLFYFHQVASFRSGMQLWQGGIETVGQSEGGDVLRIYEIYE